MNEPAECQPTRLVLRVGLTGGIATGKSTVAGMLREAGLAVVDADALVHGLLEPGGEAVEPIRREFGSSVARPDGGIDRAKLAALVFNDEQARQRLESIVHPHVLSISERQMEQIATSGEHEMVIYDAALLIEVGRHKEFQRLIVTKTSPEVQLQRLMERNHLSADAAGARIRAQMPLARKVELADYVIDNSGHWQETRKQVGELIENLRDDARQFRAGGALPTRRRTRA